MKLKKICFNKKNKILLLVGATVLALTIGK